MDLIEKTASAVTGHREPVGTIHVVDPSPLNWLWITYNTLEELVRVTPDGWIEPAAMNSYHRADDLTLDVEVREGDPFPDGEPLTAQTVKRSFDERQRWRSF